MKVSRLCGQCGRVTKERCACDKTRKASAKDYRLPAHKRGYDSQWEKLSKLFRQHHPLCQECEKRGLTTPAEHVHHITPIRQEPALRLNWDNLMALCVKCHDQIERETRKGERVYSNEQAYTTGG